MGRRRYTFSSILNRLVVLLNFVLFVSGVVLIVASGATAHWIVAKPIRSTHSDNSPSSSIKSDSSGSAIIVNNNVEKNSAGVDNLVRSGLFHGLRRLDWGVGMRSQPFVGA